MCPAGLAPYGEPCRGLQVAMDLYPSLLSADAGIAGSSGFSELYSVRRRRMASATARWGAFVNSNAGGLEFTKYR